MCRGTSKRDISRAWKRWIRDPERELTALVQKKWYRMDKGFISQDAHVEVTGQITWMNGAKGWGSVVHQK